MTEDKIKKDKIQADENIIQQKKSKLKKEEGFDSSLTLLTSTISTLQSEVNFATHAFTGNVENVQKMIHSTESSLKDNLAKIELVLEQYQINSQELQKQISILSLLPQKNQETLKELVPNITKKIENVHDQRMISIEASLKELQKQLSDDVLIKNEMLEKSANSSIEKVNQSQLKHLEEQKKMFQGLVDHTKKEIESVTSNHGTKFLRNISICVILSVLAGGISGWYINKYFPRLVSIEKTGDVMINHSHVKVWESNSVKKK